ncbi:MAG TPA: divalent-cation tolerance protein CutA [Pyrinomonadaceae bacterium]|nr:divalent-cation tolerance protein CutA [Pyrinomonadaceae bacterium]
MADESTGAIVVMMTAGSREEAVRLADILVVAHLAACVQILPEIESVYHWNGQVERSAEILLLAKTTRENFQSLEAAVRSLHSYETPEIVALPITEASAPYLEWLTANVLPQGKETSQASAANANGSTQST